MIDVVISEYVFTVDTAVPAVDITMPANMPAKNPAGMQTFQAGDNLNLLSCGITVPPPMTVSGKRNAEAYYLPFVYISVNLLKTGTTTPLSQLFSYLPFNSYELAIGNYLTVPTDNTFYLTNSFSIQSGLPKILTGIIGLPSTFNGKAFKVGCFAKIEHTLPMV